jgi:hypothetical protein
MDKEKDMHVFEEDKYDHLPSFSDLAKECHFICVQLIGRGAQRNESIPTMWRTGIFNHGYVKGHTRDRIDGIRCMLDNAAEMIEHEMNDPEKPIPGSMGSCESNIRDDKKLSIYRSVVKDPKFYTLNYLRQTFRALALLDKYTNYESMPRFVLFGIARKLKEVNAVFKIIYDNLPLDPERGSEYE